MEEILASIRRIISDDQPAVVEPPAVAPVPHFQAPVQPEAVAEEEVLDLTSPVAHSEPVHVQTHFEHAAPEPVHFEPEIPTVSESFYQEVHSQEPLITGATDKRVSNSFGSLAHTVLSQNARTIDDVVKEMLRPMLKNWMDENLPSIVERLVRSEIERVARGGR